MQMNELITRTINLRSGTPDEKRSAIREYFLKTWTIDELLYTQLKSDEVFYHRGDPLRHIILFYLGHTAAFFINKLMLAKVIKQRVNARFESIFAIGVDEMSWDDLDNNHYDWPPVSDVRDYRDQVKKVVLDVIDSVPLEIPIIMDSPFWIVMMGIEHERIHLETSSVLIRQLPLDEVTPNFIEEQYNKSGEPPKNELVDVKGAVMKLGKPMEHPFYGWDNEYGNYSEQVEDFKAAKFLTSNREFLEFIEDNGYETKSYWTEEGWKWRNFKHAQMPLFWRLQGNEYRLRLVINEIPMPWNWPVEVNYLEAKAFCNWKSDKTGKNYRLPTEVEWYRLHKVSGLKDVMEWESAPGNINLEYYLSPCPVDKFQQGDFYDVIGNVWQWTETPITGFPGFKVHSMYDDFSTPTFDGKHNLIKGGSWISTGNEATLHARYAFRRHFYQHAGFRYIESDAVLNIQSADYESDEEITISCETNWGGGNAHEPNFQKKLADIVHSVMNDNKNACILDLNADTGRLAFELAHYYDDVTALDFTVRMIRMAIQLQEQGYMRYTMKDEGELVFYREVVLSDFGLDKTKDNVLFMQGDAMNLNPNFTNYDLIVMPLLLEELRDPIGFLMNIHERLKENGYLVIASTYEWNLSVTPRENWPGGFKQDGEPATSFEGIKALLDPQFHLISINNELDLTLKKSSRITESRKVQVTIWKRKE